MKLSKLPGIILIALAGAAGCNHQSTGGESQEALVLDQSTPELIAGTYRQGNVVVQLRSQQDVVSGDLVFTRPDQSELFAVRHKGTEMSMSVLGRLTASQDVSSKKAVVPQGQGDAFSALLGTPEFALLPPLSAALEKAGFTGEAYPAAQPIHDLAAHAARMLQARKKAGGAVEMTSQAARKPICPVEVCIPEESWNEDHCQCEPPDHPEDRGEATGGCNPRNYPDLHTDPCHDGCRGMCGPGCGGKPLNSECWKFVCGDCGYHDGCALHDDMCGACYDSYGVNVIACSICLTPIAVFVAKIGC